MQYGQHARALVEELKRSEEATDLPPYNDVAVKGALQDFQLHLQALEAQAAQAPTSDPKEKIPYAIRPNIMLQKAACERNKRGLVMYHSIRLQRIQEQYYWQQATDNTAERANLSPTENKFLQQYHDLLTDYVDAAIPEISNLRGSSVPLTTDRVLCRVVDDAPFAGGPIVLESGQSVALTAGSTHFLLTTDVEEYLRSGALCRLTTEEEAKKN